MAAAPVLTTTLISVEQYLRTTYRPDCDYIDGEVFERNMGETPHARLQGFFLSYFRTREDDLQIDVLPEQRVQVAPTRFRIPDVCLVRVPNSDPLIVRTPPLLCIEILSSEDRMSSIRARALDYARMGVPATWAIDPWRRLAYAAGPDGILHEQPTHLTIPESPIAITVAEVFAELDRLEARARPQP